MIPESTSAFQLTKTNFKDYLECPREFWLRHHHPSAIIEPIDAHAQFLIRQGYEVERIARDVLAKTVDPSRTEYQHTITHENLLARFDIFQKNDDGTCTIYEVKSSKHVPSSETAKGKKEKRELNLHDLGFQVHVARLSGLQVKQAFLVTINGDYERGAELDHDAVIHFENVTGEIDELQNEIAAKIKDAFDVIEHGPHQSLEELCGKKLRCPYFEFTQPDLPEISIFDIPRISEERIAALMDIGAIDILDVPEDADLTEIQREFVNNAKKPKAFHIKADDIRSMLDSLEYPLYFLDYETVNPAIPKFKGMRSYEQITFQFSVHIIENAGSEPVHREYLSGGSGEFQLELIKALRDAIGDTGTVVSWNKSFEQGQNKLLARLYPEHAGFLESLNQRMFDLGDPFKKGLYKHPEIKGWSIKNVLPVLVPDMNYANLAVSGGATASAVWYMDVFEESENKEQTMNELSEYCKQDTHAMVRILDALS